VFAHLGFQAGQEHQLRVWMELRDTVKPTARDAVVRLRRLGLTTVLLTGDRRPTARAVAATLGCPSGE